MKPLKIVFPVVLIVFMSTTCFFVAGAILVWANPSTLQEWALVGDAIGGIIGSMGAIIAFFFAGGAVVFQMKALEQAAFWNLEASISSRNAALVSFLRHEYEVLSEQCVELQKSGLAADEAELPDCIRRRDSSRGELLQAVGRLRRRYNQDHDDH